MCLISHIHVCHMGHVSSHTYVCVSYHTYMCVSWVMSQVTHVCVSHITHIRVSLVAHTCISQQSCLKSHVWHCNTLQHTATHCNTLQHTATHCNTLQHTVTHNNTLQHCLVSPVSSQIDYSLFHLECHSAASLQYTYTCVSSSAHIHACLISHVSRLTYIFSTYLCVPSWLTSHI